MLLIYIDAKYHSVCNDTIYYIIYYNIVIYKYVHKLTQYFLKK